MLYWLIFAFVTVGAKLLLAGLTIFLILPADSRCTDCDGETILLQPGRWGRVASRLTYRALQRRWCPRCGWQGATRGGWSRTLGSSSPARDQMPELPIVPTQR